MAALAPLCCPGCLWPVHTGWRLHRRGGRIIGATPAEKVPGDAWGIWRDGRPMLAEIKARQEGLAWGDLETHQHAALAAVAAAGGVALVILVVPLRAPVILHYRTALASGWRKGKPLAYDAALALDGCAAL